MCLWLKISSCKIVNHAHNNDINMCKCQWKLMILYLMRKVHDKAMESSRFFSSLWGGAKTAARCDARANFCLIQSNSSPCEEKVIVENILISHLMLKMLRPWSFFRSSSNGLFLLSGVHQDICKTVDIKRRIFSVREHSTTSTCQNRGFASGFRLKPLYVSGHTWMRAKGLEGDNTGRRACFSTDTESPVDKIKIHILELPELHEGRN